MAYETANYSDVEPLAPGMHFLRDELDCENLGLTVVDVDGEWEGMEHDHADDGQEEVYHLVEGEATLTVDGEDVDLEPGDAVRVDPEATRELRFSADSYLVVVGAP